MFKNQIILAAKVTISSWQNIEVSFLTKCFNFFFFLDYMASFRVVPRFLVLGIFVVFCAICLADAQAYQRAQKPHIIMIVADDLVSELK